MTLDPSQAPSRSVRRRWRRRLTITLAVVLGSGLTLVCAIALLARGGPEAFEWRPPRMPPLDAGQAGTFDVTIEPRTAPIDVPVSIGVTSLEPDAAVTVVATTVDARDVRFTSWARFRADAAGNLDLEAAVPEDGTYRSADAGGLLWSMRADDGSLFHTSTEWGARSYELSVISGGQRRDAAFERRYPFPQVTREAAHDEAWSAYLTLPNGPGPHPALIYLAGWDDGPAPLTSALLARRGFAVLNVGYHGWQGLPEEMVEIPIEAVTRAIDWLEQQPEVDARRIGVWGISRGAELALAAASRHPRIVAVAAWAPASDVFAGISMRSLRQRSSWTWRGEPLPFAAAPITLDTVRVTARLLLRRPTALRPTYAAALAATDGTSAIPVERIAGEILLAAGADDRMWPSVDMVKRIAARAASSSTGLPVIELIFPEAGHGLSFALWPRGDFTERTFIRGGTPEANHLAGRQAWAETLTLFARRVRRDS